jgi:hypothetical protein
MRHKILNFGIKTFVKSLPKRFCEFKRIMYFVAKVKEKTMVNKKIGLGILAMVLVFGLAVVGCNIDNGGGGDGGSLNLQTVDSVFINTTSTSLTVGKSLQFTATVYVTNNAPQTVTWSSDDTDIATVSNTGLVTAVATGTATITATSTHDSSKYHWVTITVTPVIPTFTITGVPERYEGMYATFRLQIFGGNNIERNLAVENGEIHYDNAPHLIPEGVTIGWNATGILFFIDGAWVIYDMAYNNSFLVEEGNNIIPFSNYIRQ